MTMKCKKFSSAFNAYVVSKLKKLKVNGQSEKMPTMPITLSDSNYSDLKCKESALMSSTTTNIKNKNSPEIISSGQMHHNHLNHHHQQSSPQQQQYRQSNGEDTNRLATAQRHPASACATGQTTVPQKRSANDFRFGKSIGEGSFSTVYLAEDIHTRKEYAIKVCDKQHILRERKHEYIKREREVLNMLNNCPGFVNLYCTFQDIRNLYFVMTYAKNGDMLPYIRKVGSFDLDCTRFYAAELVLALEQMHRKGVIHRDLKPENILLDENMHTLIADFGSAKVVAHGDTGLCNADTRPCDLPDRNQQEEENNMSRRRRNSFVGTAQYVSPEILNGRPTSRATDLWALGCIIYQMISGLPPFRAATEYLIFQKVLQADMTFPEGFDPTAADLVEKLIQLEPNQRLGTQDKGDVYDSIRNHPFFDGVNWTGLRQQTPPLIYPYLPGLEADEKQREQYRVPEYIEPGFDEKQLNRLIGMEIGTSESITYQTTNNQTSTEPKSILDISDSEKARRLEEQAKTNMWHPFADGELIVKQGFINKRKGLFARRRMLLLTTGPRLIYIDPTPMVKKGEIPWTSDLKVEPKNFKVFFVHTPNRTYYLEDPENHTALEWFKAIDDVRKFTYEKKN